MTPRSRRAPSRMSSERGDALAREHDVGGDDRRAGAAVHRDADVGERERGGVVHAVADHHDGAGRAPAGSPDEAGDDVALRLGGEAAEGVLGRQPELGADPRDDVRMVAGEDPDADAARAKGRDGLLGVGAQRVADAGDAARRVRRARRRRG